MHVAHGCGFGVGSILLHLFCSELRPGVEVAGVDSINPSGEDRREKGCMVESDAVTQMWKDGGISRCWREEIDGKRLLDWFDGKTHIVQWLRWWAASAGDDG